MTQEITPTSPVQSNLIAQLVEEGRLPALVAAVDSVKAPEAIKEEVVVNFADFFERIERYVTPAFALVVADETEKEKMFDAAQAVTALKGLEKSLTAKHGEMKHDALKYSQALDATKRAALALIQPAVEHLKAQAEYIERKEAARIEALRVERYNLILPYLTPEILPTPWPEWGTMHQSDFENTLAFAIEKARQIEAERVARIEKEKAEREELERLRVETANQARELAEARALAQQAELGLIVTEQQKEDNALRSEFESTHQTDRDKLRAYGAALLRVPCAPIQDPAMQKVLEQVKILLVKVDKFIEEKTA